MPSAGSDTLKPPSVNDPVLDEVVRRLVDAYHPFGIYLFGSKARAERLGDMAAVPGTG